MKCPICEIDMRVADREGVEIDYCPTCRGVWLDRGELEKIIARTAPLENRDDRYHGDHDDDHSDHDNDDDHHDDRRFGRYPERDDRRYRDQRRRGFWGNLMEIFD